MKKLFMIILIFATAITTTAQIDLSFGMGLDFNNVSSYRDYVNENFAPADNQISTFKSSVMFLSEVDYYLPDKFQIGLEYNLLIDSYNTPVGVAGIYEISYNVHRPSLLGYYVIYGKGYKFKFGVGAGPRFASLTEKIVTQTNYNSTGLGFLLKAEGHTALSTNFYAVIGVDARYDLVGEPSYSNGKIHNNVNGENLNLNSISVGLKLGISLTF
ncbi:hypothetical protein ABRY23_05480 [Melioribacteraceae bacterium 4301-Me]|uniref:hypothetical protein n=1 Tax=Pyranulibacter aquaticus TaxID=3163344 RepID=UPI0035962A94